MKLSVLFSATVLLSSCASPNIQRETSIETISRHYADMRPQRFHKEIERVQENTQKPLDGTARALLHLELALLYAHYRNPAPNYSMALKELEAYGSLASEGANAEVTRDWLSLLREIVRLEKENKEMKEKVEQLKDLDIELEKRRKLVK